MEKLPSPSDRLENFERNKSLQQPMEEQKAFEESLYGREAGVTDFSDEALRRLQEASTYEQHLERMTGDTRSAYDRGLDRLDNHEVDDDIQRRIEASPELRRMQMLAKEIAALRVDNSNPSERDRVKLSDKENRLQELLVEYEGGSPDADPAITDRIIETTYATPVNEPQSSAEAEIPEEETTVLPVAAETVTPPEPADSKENAPADQPEITSENDHLGESAPEEQEPTQGSAEGGKDEVESAAIDNNDEVTEIESEGSKKPRRINPLHRLAAAFQTRLNKLQEEASRPENKKYTRAAIATFVGVVAVGAAYLSLKHGVDDPTGGSLGNYQPQQTPDPGNFGGNFGHGTVEAVSGYDFSTAAHDVFKGEGWYQTFADMNIPRSEWHDILDKVGPQLQQKGWAYQMDGGQWGIAHSGRLPQNVLELIQNNR